MTPTTQQILANGQLLGVLNEDDNLIILTVKGAYTGKYMKKANVTVDKNGNNVGTGNTLMRLLPR